ncbi:RNA pseudouridine synthase 1-like [Magnolia sinica]|uniref:RNA pseudouridine synthase 1-like n=1 Tax=Magnolia sinica TaxID=86752 RepID=UPI0026597AE3|nr:RNA pseudouridine synthase 1-like [Magnolia sinica]
MTKTPLPFLLCSHLLPYNSLLLTPSPKSIKSSAVRFLCRPSSLPTMAEKTQFDSTEIGPPNASKTQNFPTPLSPPLPPISKQIELQRAMTASSKSSLFSLSRSGIVFEDESLIVVNKPSGIYCESVLSSARHFLNESSLGSTDVGIEITPLELHLANRLDRDTSGLMIITKSHKVAAKLVKAFTDHRVKKTYLALCVGPTPKWDKINIKSGHGRSKFGVWRVYASSDIGRSLPGGSVVRDMATSFEIISVNRQGSFKEPTKFSTDENPGMESVVVEDQGTTRIEVGDENSGEILIRAYPKSGRTHQIRLHCQYLGIPIRGDVKYEGVYEWRGNAYETHALHAESLEFYHPVTGIPIEFRAPLPIWASEACQEMVQGT